MVIATYEVVKTSRGTGFPEEDVGLEQILEKLSWFGPIGLTAIGLQVRPGGKTGVAREGRDRWWPSIVSCSSRRDGIVSAAARAAG